MSFARLARIALLLVAAAGCKKAAPDSAAKDGLSRGEPELPDSEDALRAFVVEQGIIAASMARVNQLPSTLSDEDRKTANDAVIRQVLAERRDLVAKLPGAAEALERAAAMWVFLGRFRDQRDGLAHTRGDLSRMPNSDYLAALAGELPLPDWLKSAELAAILTKVYDEDRSRSDVLKAAAVRAYLGKLPPEQLAGRRGYAAAFKDGGFGAGDPGDPSARRVAFAVIGEGNGTDYFALLSGRPDQQNVSIVSVVTEDGRSRAYYEDMAGNGPLTHPTAVRFTNSCLLCHHSGGARAIVPAPEPALAPDDQRDLAAINEHIATRRMAHHPVYDQTRSALPQGWPALGLAKPLTAADVDRLVRMVPDASTYLPSFSKADADVVKRRLDDFNEAGACGRCHNDQKRGRLSPPFFARGAEKLVALGAMPPPGEGPELTLAERGVLARLLAFEFTDRALGLVLGDWWATVGIRGRDLPPLQPAPTERIVSGEHAGMPFTLHFANDGTLAIGGREVRLVRTLRKPLRDDPAAPPADPGAMYLADAVLNPDVVVEVRQAGPDAAAPPSARVLRYATQPP